MTSSSNYYEILGVSPNADISELRHAFRTLSKSLHPDTTSIPPDIATRKFQEVCEAYNFLSDPELRANYDSVVLKEPLKMNKSSIYGFVSNPFERSQSFSEVRRSLSGGELFSLSMLAIAFLFCILLAIGFAFVQGRDLFVIPTWMIN